MKRTVMLRKTALAVRTTKNEILRDMRRGIVPRSVRSFSELHDHVDANEYAARIVDGVYDELGLDAGCDFLNIVQDAVHRWLESGRRAS